MLFILVCTVCVYVEKLILADIILFIFFNSLKLILAYIGLYQSPNGYQT